MQIFFTPKGKAGGDVLAAIEESVQAHLDQMFEQDAKHSAIEHGVGRTGAGHDSGERKARVAAQLRECEAQMNFHAGRALDLAMQLVYAKGTDRILGREYPGVDGKVISKDRKTHELKALYDRIVAEVGRGVDDEFEDSYRRALHKGFLDVILDDEPLVRITLPRNAPFTEKSRGGTTSGAEITHDHGDLRDLFGFVSLNSETDFGQLPQATFPEFLAKADSMYYASDLQGRRRNMRWEDYASRDHESGRPYAVIGCEFFARLVGGIVDLSDNQRLWDDDFALRWHERSRHIVGETVGRHLVQRYEKGSELAPMRSPEDMLREIRQAYRPAKVLDSYESLHRTVKLESVSGDDLDVEGRS